MRILLDHNVPAPLRFALRTHFVETTYERGWAEFSNGDLVSAAESDGYDLLVTTDKGLRYQQNWSGRKLALLVLSTNDWTRIRLSLQAVFDAIDGMSLAGYAYIEIPRH